MSYINFSLTHQYTAGAIGTGRSETIAAGFGREGGRVEFVERSTALEGAAPTVVPIALGGGVTAAANALRDAIQGGDWVQDVTVQHGDGGQADSVAWTLRGGGEQHTGRSGALPAHVQDVIDAANALDLASQSPR